MITDHRHITSDNKDTGKINLIRMCEDLPQANDRVHNLQAILFVTAVGIQSSARESGTAYQNKSLSRLVQKIGSHTYC